MDKTTKNIIIIVLIIILVSIRCWLSKEFAPAKKSVTICDTTYNIATLDSIRLNIKVKDSVVVELKKRVEYEMEQAINADDSIAIIQFKELASSN